MERTRQAKSSSPRLHAGPCRLLFLLASGIALLCPVLAQAQEVVDERTGHLMMTVTDLSLPAGAATLSLERSLARPEATETGLLGTRWRLGWEMRLVRSDREAVLHTALGQQRFALVAPAGQYANGLGDRLSTRMDDSAVLETRYGHRLTFDPQGRLTAQDEGQGKRIEFDYDHNGRLTQVRGPRGNSMRLMVRPDGRLARVETSTGEVATYTYENGELAGCETTRSPRVQYRYDPEGRLSEIESPWIGTRSYLYDLYGRVAMRSTSDGQIELFEYDASAREVRRIIPAVSQDEDAAPAAVTTTRFGADGRTKTIIDPDGNQRTTEYDEKGRLVRSVGPDGREIKYAYDELGRSVKVDDAGCCSTSIEYVDDTHRVRRTASSDGTTQSFKYDYRGNVTEVRHNDEVVSRMAYTDDGLLKEVVGPGQRSRYLTYNDRGQLTALADSLGNVVRYEYDEKANLVRITNPLGGVTKRTHDNHRRLLTETSPAGDVTTYEYDTTGRLARVVGPSGQAHAYHYDATGRRTGEEDAAGRREQYVRQPDQQTLLIVNADGTRQQVRVDAMGRTVATVDELGQTTQFSHNARGQVESVRLPTGHQIQYRYDLAGRLVSVDDPLTGATQSVRDEQGRLSETREPGGTVHRYEWDASDRLVRYQDPLGGATEYGYNAAGDLLSVTTPTGVSAQYTRDSEGRLTAMKTADGRETRFTYDPMGNVTQIDGPDGKRTRQEYDPSGRLVQSVDAAGRTVRYTYGADGQVAKTSVDGGLTIQNTYGPLGELRCAEERECQVRLHYDDLARLVRTEYVELGQSVRVSYDASGRRVRLEGAGGVAVRYGYDEFGRLARIGLPTGQVVELRYDAADRPLTIHYPNGVTGTWRYGVAGRLESLTYRDQSNEVLVGWTYTYDKAGNLTNVQPAGGQEKRYAYDKDGRLIDERQGRRRVRYEYRPGGDRAMARNGSQSVRYTYGSGGEVLTAGAEQFEHDPLGNMTLRTQGQQQTRYQYDTLGRLTQAVVRGQEVSFGYGPTGERIWRRDAAGLTHFLYDGIHRFQDLDEQAEPVATYIHGVEIDWPIAMIRDGRAHFYHPDAIGTVARITDERGTVVATYDCDAFGNVLSQTGTIPNPFIFAGRSYEPALGLYYYRARYYDPKLGRFVTPDPAAPDLERPGSLNRYVYALNAPTRYADPLGLIAMEGASWEARRINPGERMAWNPADVIRATPPPPRSNAGTYRPPSPSSSSIPEGWFSRMSRNAKSWFKPKPQYTDTGTLILDQPRPPGDTVALKAPRPSGGWGAAVEGMGTSAGYGAGFGGALSGADAYNACIYAGGSQSECIGAGAWAGIKGAGVGAVVGAGAHLLGAGVTAVLGTTAAAALGTGAAVVGVVGVTAWTGYHVLDAAGFWDETDIGDRASDPAQAQRYVQQMKDAVAQLKQMLADLDALGWRVVDAVEEADKRVRVVESLAGQVQKFNEGQQELAEEATSTLAELLAQVKVAAEATGEQARACQDKLLASGGDWPSAKKASLDGAAALSNAVRNFLTARSLRNEMRQTVGQDAQDAEETAEEKLAEADKKAGALMDDAYMGIADAWDILAQYDAAERALRARARVVRRQIQSLINVLPAGSARGELSALLIEADISLPTRPNVSRLQERPTLSQRLTAAEAEYLAARKPSGSGTEDGEGPAPTSRQAVDSAEETSQSPVEMVKEAEDLVQQARTELNFAINLMALQIESLNEAYQDNEQMLEELAEQAQRPARIRATVDPQRRRLEALLQQRLSPQDRQRVQAELQKIDALDKQVDAEEVRVQQETESLEEEQKDRDQVNGVLGVQMEGAVSAAAGD